MGNGLAAEEGQWVYYIPTTMANATEILKALEKQPEVLTLASDVVIRFNRKAEPILYITDGKQVFQLHANEDNGKFRVARSPMSWSEVTQTYRPLRHPLIDVKWPSLENYLTWPSRTAGPRQREEYLKEVGVDQAVLLFDPSTLQVYEQFIPSGERWNPIQRLVGGEMQAQLSAQLSQRYAGEVAQYQYWQEQERQKREEWAVESKRREQQRAVEAEAKRKRDEQNRLEGEWEEERSNRKLQAMRRAEAERRDAARYRQIQAPIASRWQGPNWAVLPDLQRP